MTTVRASADSGYAPEIAPVATGCPFNFRQASQDYAGLISNPFVLLILSHLKTGLDFFLACIAARR
jgi:hypothetical protein